MLFFGGRIAVFNCSLGCPNSDSLFNTDYKNVIWFNLFFWFIWKIERASLLESWNLRQNGRKGRFLSIFNAWKKR